MDNKISTDTKAELIRVLGIQYHKTSKIQKTQILDQFIAGSGYHRKHTRKRNLTDSLNLKEYWSQLREMFLLVITHSLHIVLFLSQRSFLHSRKYLLKSSIGSNLLFITLEQLKPSGVLDLFHASFTNGWPPNIIVIEK